MVASMLSTVTHAMGAHVVDYPGNVRTADARPRAARSGCEIPRVRRRRRLGVPRRALRARVGAARRRPRSPRRPCWRPPVRHRSGPLPQRRRPCRCPCRRVRHARQSDWERDLREADVGCVAVTTEGIEAMLWSDSFRGSRATWSTSSIRSSSAIHASHPSCASPVRARAPNRGSSRDRRPTPCSRTRALRREHRQPPRTPCHPMTIGRWIGHVSRSRGTDRATPLLIVLDRKGGPCRFLPTSRSARSTTT